MEEPKRKRGRPPGSKDKHKRPNRQVLPDEKKEYNERLIKFNIAITPEYMINKEHPPAENIDEMKKRFQNYLVACIEFNMKPCNSSAYLAIGTDRHRFHEWLTQSNAELRSFAEYVKDYFSATREQMMVDGEINPVVGIFHQKNYDGFKDQQEHIVSTNSLVDESIAEEELARKYLESADIASISYEESTDTIVDTV